MGSFQWAPKPLQVLCTPSQLAMWATDPDSWGWESGVGMRLEQPWLSVTWALSPVSWTSGRCPVQNFLLAWYTSSSTASPTFHSSLCYLSLNSATFGGNLLYSPVITVQIKMSRLLANVWGSKTHYNKGACSMANIPAYTAWIWNSLQRTIRETSWKPYISRNVFYLKGVFINSLGTFGSSFSDTEKNLSISLLFPFLN